MLEKLRKLLANFRHASKSEPDKEWEHLKNERNERFKAFSNDIKSINKSNIDDYFNLANEWLKSHPEGRQEEAIKESQKIINNLCEKFRNDPNKSQSDILLILQKISDVYKNTGRKNFNFSPLWNKIKYNLSNLDIAVPIKDMHLHNVDFSNSRFKSPAGFESCKFSGDCKFWRASSEGSFFIKSSEIFGEMNFISFNFFGYAEFSDLEIDYQSPFKFMNARFYGDSVFDDIRFSENCRDGMYTSMNMAYFSIKCNHTFRPEEIFYRMVENTLNGVTMRLPIESLLFDPDAEESENEILSQKSRKELDD